VDDLFEQDRLAIDSVRERLIAFSPDLLIAFDDVIMILEKMSEALNQGSSDEDDIRIVNECGEELGAKDNKELYALLAKPDQDVRRVELISRVRAAMARVSARRVREILLGLLWRSFAREATDLLRLRTSASPNNRPRSGGVAAQNRA
jgi:hypothetical protein